MTLPLPPQINAANNCKLPNPVQDLNKMLNKLQQTAAACPTIQSLPMRQPNHTNISNQNATNVNMLPQLQALQVEERKRKIRKRFQQNAFFAGGIKNKLFETMTRVLNGLQQELIQYNGKFAEPINEMNLRIVALQRLDVHNLDGIWDSNDGLFEPMMRNINEIKKFNNNMWNKINEFHNLAESQIKQSMKQLQSRIDVINRMKAQYILKQQQIQNNLKRQFQQRQQQNQSKVL